MTKLNVSRETVGRAIADSIVSKRDDSEAWDALSQLGHDYVAYRQAGWDENKLYSLKQIAKIAAENSDAESIEGLLAPLPHIDENDIADLKLHLRDDPLA